MTTYAWTEHHMFVKSSEAGLTDVVKRVVAVYTADDGAGHTAQQLMNITLGPPDPENFTPYEDLTLLQVIGWIENIVDTSYWQGALDQRIADSLLNNPPCPWD